MRIIAYGKAAPQGSKRHVGHGIMIESSKAVKPWRERVHHAALEALAGAPRIEGPVQVHVVFYFDRPKNHYRTGRNADLLRDNAPAFPTGGVGDLDKLQRSCFDSLSTAGVWRDDSQVVAVTAEKRFTCDEAFLPCAVIDVVAVDLASVA